MLMPRKTKYRRHHRGRRAGTSKGQTTVQFGDYGLKSLEAGWVTVKGLDGNKTDQARAVGKAIAEAAKKVGVETVVFDRGGYLYHGRVKALADGAREGGLEF